ncbi:YncE family protein [Pseudoalteromonas spongiae]|uniref:YncE family protein n=1 Tax=Pseudoalteromonas spongiae TaxID=298657 RepID=A0ABU8EW54_9GAMM
MRLSHYLTVILITLNVISFSLMANDDTLSGTLVVVNKKADTVSFIDLQSRKIKYTRRTGKGPHEIAVNDNATTAVITDYNGGNSLTVFDIKTAKATNTISLAKHPYPHGILYLKGTNKVAVSAEGSNSVVIVDIDSGNIEKAINTFQKGSHMVALAHFNNRVYTPNMHDDTVSEMDINTGKLLRTIATPETPEAITINKSGTELWVGSNKDGFVTVFDLTTEKVIKQWRGFKFPYRILLTKDEKYAVVPDYKNNTLTIFDAVNKTQLHQITFDNIGPKGVAFHPNDRTLFLSAYSKNKLLAIDIPSGKTLFELPTGNGPDGIGYSPIVLE